jgi:hypothetical protein
MPSVWTDELEKCLLLALLDTCATVSRKRFSEVAERIGHGLTQETCRYVLDFITLHIISPEILHGRQLGNRSMLLLDPSHINTLRRLQYHSIQSLLFSLHPKLLNVVSPWFGTRSLKDAYCYLLSALHQHPNGTRSRRRWVMNSRVNLFGKLSWTHQALRSSPGLVAAWNVPCFRDSSISIETSS